MNRYVLSFPLNVSVLALSLIWLGRVFHNFGPYTLNDLLENVHLLVEELLVGTWLLLNAIQDVLSSFLLWVLVGTWVLGCFGICRWVLQSWNLFFLWFEASGVDLLILVILLFPITVFHSYSCCSLLHVLHYIYECFWYSSMALA